MPTNIADIKHTLTHNLDKGKNGSTDLNNYAEKVAACMIPLV